MLKKKCFPEPLSNVLSYPKVNPENSASFNPALWLRFCSPRGTCVDFCETHADVKTAFGYGREVILHVNGVSLKPTCEVKHESGQQCFREALLHSVNDAKIPSCFAFGIKNILQLFSCKGAVLYSG